MYIKAATILDPIVKPRNDEAMGMTMSEERFVQKYLTSKKTHPPITLP